MTFVAGQLELFIDGQRVSGTDRTVARVVRFAEVDERGYYRTAHGGGRIKPGSRVRFRDTDWTRAWWIAGAFATVGPIVGVVRNCYGTYTCGVELDDPAIAIEEFHGSCAPDQLEAVIYE